MLILDTDEVEQYFTKRPIGSAVITNNMTVEVMDILHGIEDEVIYRYFTEGVLGCYYYGKSIIESDLPNGEDDSRFYFNVGELKIFLDEVMRLGGNDYGSEAM